MRQTSQTLKTCKSQDDYSTRLKTPNFCSYVLYNKPKPKQYFYMIEHITHPKD